MLGGSVVKLTDRSVTRNQSDDQSEHTDNTAVIVMVHNLQLLTSQVKVLFVRNLANSVTEEILEKSFSEYGNLERVKKLKDYAFIHFEERDGAVKVGLPFISEMMEPLQVG